MVRFRFGGSVARALIASVVLAGFVSSGTVAWAQGTVGPIVFARGEEAIEPVEPTDVFDEGTDIIYAFVEFEDLRGTDVISGIWYLDDEVALTQATTIGQVLGVAGAVPVGKFYFSIMFEDGAEAGSYRLELSLNAALVQTGDFTVEAATGEDESARGEDNQARTTAESSTAESAAAESAASGDATAVNATTGDALPAAGRLIFSDDFDDPESGWGTNSNEYGSVAYEAGRLVFTLIGRNLPTVSLLGETFDDAVIDVRAETLGGPEDNALGIVVRYQDIDNYYAFLVSADGYYAMFHLLDGSPFWHQEWQYDQQDGIERGMAANDLRVIANGPTLSFYVNGSLRGEVHDALWSEGKVGVFGGVFEEPGVKVGFDEWRVWSLAAGE